jgi:hypothetical protein
LVILFDSGANETRTAFFDKSPLIAAAGLREINDGA